MEAILELLRY